MTLADALPFQNPTIARRRALDLALIGLGSIAVAAALTGRLAERGWDRRFWTAVLAMAVGELTVYAGGGPWSGS